MDDEELKATKALVDAAYREDSIAGLEAHYEKIKALAPKLIAEVERLRAENATTHARLLAAYKRIDYLESLAGEGDE